MPLRRRTFLRRGVVGSVATIAGCRNASRSLGSPHTRGRLAIAPADTTLRPLQTLTCRSATPGFIILSDGAGRPYAHVPIRGSVALTVGGALGTHRAALFDADGRAIDAASFRVDARTTIRDGSGRFSALLRLAHWTMQVDHDLLAHHVAIGERVYHPLVYWLRDHVLTLHGARWFRGDLRSGIDLYADLQREDGMIWDNVERRPNAEPTWWQTRFAYGDFIRTVDDGRWELKRIPVTNDVEALFVDGLHATWQATGDDAWMTARLPAAIAALEYATRDPYRWSTEQRLLKRGYTIDHWDFLSDFDAARTGDAMVVTLDATAFGIHFGDNLLYAAACRKLARMLQTGGQPEAARRFAARADAIATRIAALAWNDTHYLHHVSTSAVERDFGVDERTQVSLSNAYALTWGIDSAHADAIVRTYQNVRDRLPDGSPGEWYSIVPPFSRGFADHAAPWEYVNGGVLPIVAGRLAHGALIHGHERYGVDVLVRAGALAQLSDGVLEGAYRGARAERPARSFRPLPIESLLDFRWPPPDATQGGEPFAQAGEVVLADVTFSIGRRGDRSAIVLGGSTDARSRVTVPIGSRVASLYVLHEAEGDLAGAATFRYVDRTIDPVRVPIDRRHYGDWWREPEARWPMHRPPCRRVFRSDDLRRFCTVWVAGIDNPHPDAKVSSIVLDAAPDDKPWRIAALTTCDAPVFFDPGPISYGIPVGWGGSAIAAALIEGLAGIEDRAAGLRAVTIAPRWAAADETRVTALARYPDGDGYAAYRYRYDPARSRLSLRFTGSAEDFAVRVLLPDGFVPTHGALDGRRFSLADAGAPVQAVAVEATGSRYAVATVRGAAVHWLTLTIRRASGPPFSVTGGLG